MDRGARVGRGEGAVRQRAERLVPGVLVGVALAEADDDVQHGHAGLARGVHGADHARQVGVVLDAPDHRVLQVHREQGGVRHDCPISRVAGPMRPSERSTTVTSRNATEMASMNQARWCIPGVPARCPKNAPSAADATIAPR